VIKVEKEGKLPSPFVKATTISTAQNLVETEKHHETSDHIHEKVAKEHVEAEATKLFAQKVKENLAKEAEQRRKLQEKADALAQADLKEKQRLKYVAQQAAHQEEENINKYKTQLAEEAKIWEEKNAKLQKQLKAAQIAKKQALEAE